MMRIIYLAFAIIGTIALFTVGMVLFLIVLGAGLVFALFHWLRRKDILNPTEDMWKNPDANPHEQGENVTVIETEYYEVTEEEKETKHKK